MASVGALRLRLRRRLPRALGFSKTCVIFYSLDDMDAFRRANSNSFNDHLRSLSR